MKFKKNLFSKDLDVFLVCLVLSCGIIVLYKIWLEITFTVWMIFLNTSTNEQNEFALVCAIITSIFIPFFLYKIHQRYFK